MEEILASIRRIISEDGGGKEEQEEVAEAAPPPPAAEEPQPEVEAEEAMPEPAEDIGFEEELDEVLELTEPLPEEPAAAEPDFELAVDIEVEPDYAPEPVESAASEPDFMEPEEDEDIAFGEPVMSAQPTPASAYKPAPAAPGAGLLSGDAANAASAAFGALANNLLTSSGEGGRTLEDLVADLLRPMLKDWLDRNLPPLVEQLVREEIERVARRGR